MTTPVLHVSPLRRSRLGERVGGDRWVVSDHAVHCARTVATEVRRCWRGRADYGVIIGVLGGMEIILQALGRYPGSMSLSWTADGEWHSNCKSMCNRRRHQSLTPCPSASAVLPRTQLDAFVCPSGTDGRRSAFSLIRKKVRLRQCDNPQPP